MVAHDKHVELTPIRSPIHPGIGYVPGIVPGVGHGVNKMKDLSLMTHILVSAARKDKVGDVTVLGGDDGQGRPLPGGD